MSIRPNNSFQPTWLNSIVRPQTMRATYLLAHLAVLLLALVPRSGITAEPCTRLDRLECVSGTYTISSVMNYRGGLTTDKEAQSLVGARLVLTPSLFTYRNKNVANPRYEFEVVTLPTEEGDIGPKDVSTFWGYEVSRTKVVKLTVYSGENYVWEFEVISTRKLLDANDGYFYEATR